MRSRIMLPAAVVTALLAVGMSSALAKKPKEVVIQGTVPTTVQGIVEVEINTPEPVPVAVPA